MLLLSSELGLDLHIVFHARHFLPDSCILTDRIRTRQELNKLVLVESSEQALCYVDSFQSSAHLCITREEKRAVIVDAKSQCSDEKEQRRIAPIQKFSCK